MHDNSLHGRHEPSPLLVTHYARQDPEQGIWLPLPFVTREAGKADRFFFGFNKTVALEVGDIDDRLKAGVLCSLERSYPIQSDEQLWLAPDGDVWLATKVSPLRDPMRRLVDAGALRRAREERQRDKSALVVSPVLESVRSSGNLFYLEGDYTNSNVAPSSNFFPLWQQRLIDAVVRRSSSYLSGTVVPRSLTRIEHRYSHIASLVLRHEVAVCLELILCDEDRASENISVVQVGNVTHYALLFVPGSPVERRLSETMESGERWTKPVAWYAMLRDTGSVICGHAGTAANNALDILIMKGELKPERKKERERIEELSEFLRKHPDDGVIVCDVGVVSQIAHIHQRGHGNRRVARKLQSLHHFLVPYANPIPLGLAYDARDPFWASLLHNALGDISSSSDPRVQQSLADSAERVSQLGGQWTLPIGSDLVAQQPAYSQAGV